MFSPILIYQMINKLNTRKGGLTIETQHCVNLCMYMKEIGLILENKYIQLHVLTIYIVYTYIQFIIFFTFLLPLLPSF